MVGCVCMTPEIQLEYIVIYRFIWRFKRIIQKSSKQWIKKGDQHEKKISKLLSIPLHHSHHHRAKNLDLK